MNGRNGTKKFMAPEMVDDESYYSAAVDIWSTGIIFFKLLSRGDHPFYEKGDTLETF